MLIFLSPFVLAEENNNVKISINNENNNLEVSVNKSITDSSQKPEIREQVKKRITEQKKINANIKQVRQQSLAVIKELRVKNVAEVKELIKANREELKVMVQEEKTKLRVMRQKQNEVRVAVHALLASENIAGGIGKEVSTIAQEFDNSAKEIEEAEEKAINRGRFTKFLFGGDRESAEIIRNRVQTREEKVKRLEELVETGDCDKETKQLLQEQVQVIKQEQERLKEVTKNQEKGGLLGWLFK